MARPHRVRRAGKSPSSDRLQAVDKLIEQEQFNEAEQDLERLADEFSGHPAVLALQGRLSQTREEYGAAVEHYRAALAVNPGQESVRINLAACLCQTQELDEALTLVEGILARNDRHPRALAVKGDVLRAQHNLPGALDCYQTALRLEPDNALRYLSLSHLTRFSAGDPIFRVLPRKLEDPELSVKRRASLLAALGKACLDIGDNDAAFEYYQQANQLMDEYLPPINAELERNLNFTRKSFTRPLFRKLAEHGIQETHQIIVAGMSRSGKSLVESLFRHAEGVTLAGEELVLGRYAGELLKPHGGRLLDYLADLTPARLQADARGYLQELAPDEHLKVTTVPGDLWLLGLLGLWTPNTPIIFCVRGLLDLGVTGYFQQYQSPKGFRYSYDLKQLGRQIACSEKVMDHWLQVLPNPVYLVEYEKLVQDPEAVMENLFQDLGLSRKAGPDAQQAHNAALLEQMSPIVSTDAPMPVTDRFLGIGEGFRKHLEPLIEGYQQIAEGFPRYEEPAPFARHPLPQTLYDASLEHVPSEQAPFDWSLGSRVMAVDNGGQLLQGKRLEELLKTDAFGLLVLDPASNHPLDETRAQREDLQYVPHATLGDGGQISLYAALDPDWTGTLKPLPPEQLPAGVREAARTLTSLPISSIALDSIEGLPSLDWLLLDGRHDSLTILQHGSRALADTLLLQLDLSFEPTHEGAPQLVPIQQWAEANGFQLYRFTDMRHGSGAEALPELVRPLPGSRLRGARALFIPARERLEQLGDAERLKLAFLLDAVYQLHDLAYTQLQAIGTDLANRYLQARGFHDLPKGEISEKEGHQISSAINEVRFQQADKLIQALRPRHPASAHLRSLNAQLRVARGQVEQALAEAGEAIRRAPRSLPIRMEAVEILILGGLWWEAARHAQRLLEVRPKDPALQRLWLRATLSQPVPTLQELEQARSLCTALLQDAPGDSLLQALQGLLHAHQGEHVAAVAAHDQAQALLGEDDGRLAAELQRARAQSLALAAAMDESCEALWQACCARPFSRHTVLAYRQLGQRLPDCSSAEWQDLAALHSRVQEIWSSYRKEGLQHAFGDFNLPYQGFEPLKLAGTRPALQRLQAYGLEQELPSGARALDIGCNHGYLLLGLADRLSYGEGFDISQACIDVGKAVAAHLNLDHMHLHNTTFEQFQCETPFDLVIACAVHRWIGLPLPEFGARLYEYCKPGGIVLLESQGERSTSRTEKDFEQHAAEIADVGFQVVRTGSLCDDGINLREFWVLRRPA